MGLDMYLNKRSYVQQWDHNEKNHTVTVRFDGKVRKDILAQSKPHTQVVH
jgi:hypothetical protein